MPQPLWLSGRPGAWVLSLHAQPGSRVFEVVGEHGGALKVRIAAPPVDGKANEALLRWLSERLSVPRRDLALLAGASSRAKRVSLAADRSANEVVAALAGATP